MSEWITAFIEAIPASQIATRHRSAVLGTAIGEIGRAISSQIEAIEQIQPSGLQTSTTTRLLSLHQSLKQQDLSPLDGETAKRLTPQTTEAIQNLEATLASGRLAGTITPAQVDVALKDLTSAVQSAHQTLALQEQETATNHLHSVLSTRGYTVRISEAEAGPARLIRAKKGEQVIAARVADTGTLEMDMAGFEPEKCTQERSAIVGQLQRRGYQIRLAKQVVHNRREGGEIVKAIEKSFQETEDRLRRLNLARAQKSRRQRR
jgi:hypothetical protein